MTSLVDVMDGQTKRGREQLEEKTCDVCSDKGSDELIGLTKGNEREVSTSGKTVK